ncbi:MAG TPA: DUF4013 domain-containing protein [Thermoanaerobaculia bacterium]|nr:DUF4013 domain-containing protein [Thermoanaerobaculia bacterium]
MTDVYAPPPPPPPPPARPDSVAFDFIRPFAFVFEDPRWLPKVLIGGLFVLASFVLIGAFFLFGYIARLVRNVIAGMQHPLPEWDDLGEYFGEGLLLFVVALIYSAPVVLLAILVAVPAMILSGVQSDNVRDIGGGVFGCAWCVIAPLSLALWFIVPAALLMVITSGRFGAAFEFSRIWSFIKENIGNYLLAIVVYLVSRFAAGFGLILLCIGIIFTEFWAMTVAGYAFGEVYRLSQKR